MKFCKDCKHFLPPVRYLPPLCQGPHVRLSVVTGERRMSLPEARYSGGQGLDPEQRPCGETEANHWEAK